MTKLDNEARPALLSQFPLKLDVRKSVRFWSILDNGQQRLTKGPHHPKVPFLVEGMNLRGGTGDLMEGPEIRVNDFTDRCF